MSSCSMSEPKGDAIFPLPLSTIPQRSEFTPYPSRTDPLESIDCLRSREGKNSGPLPLKSNGSLGSDANRVNLKDRTFRMLHDLHCVYHSVSLS